MSYYFYWAKGQKDDPSPVKIDTELGRADEVAIVPGSKQLLDESTCPLSLDRLAVLYPCPCLIEDVAAHE